MKNELQCEIYEKELKLLVTDILIIREMKESDLFSAEKKTQFCEKIKELKIDTIIRIAQNLEFENSCKDLELNSYWTFLHSTYGIVLTSDKHLFSNYEHSCPFNQLRGMYFFYQSHLTQKLLKKDFTVTEIKFLRKAVHLGSIHAISRFNQYLYKCISQSKSQTQIRNYFEKIISNCQNTVIHYGCYSYMMLAEAYFRFSLQLCDEKNLDDGADSYRAALESCALAKDSFAKSKYAIADASLGQGLAASNSLGLTTPHAALLWLQKNQPPVLAKDALKVSSPFPPK